MNGRWLAASAALAGIFVFGCSTSEPSEGRDTQSSNLTGDRGTEGCVDETATGGAEAESPREEPETSGRCVCTTDTSNRTSRRWYFSQEDCEANPDGREGGIPQGAATPVDVTGVNASCTRSRIQVFYFDPRMSFCSSTSIGIDDCSRR